MITLKIEDGAFWKLPYFILSMFQVKRKEKDTAMLIIASPVDNSKWRLS